MQPAMRCERAVISADLGLRDASTEEDSRKSKPMRYVSFEAAVVSRGPVLLKAQRIFKNKERKQGFLLSKKNNSCNVES